MKERCHVCERKVKDGVEVCKACKSPKDEMLQAGFSALHIINLDNGKSHRFRLEVSFTDPALSASDFWSLCNR